MSGYQVLVREKVNSPPGTSTIQLNGAVNGYASFVSTYANNATIIGYVIDSINPQNDQTGTWESGTGQFVTNSTGNFLLRITPYDSSLGVNTFINFTTNCYACVNPLAQTEINAFGAISSSSNSLSGSITSLSTDVVDRVYEGEIGAL